MGKARHFLVFVLLAASAVSTSAHAASTGRGHRGSSKPPVTIRYLNAALHAAEAQRGAKATRATSVIAAAPRGFVHVFIEDMTDRIGRYRLLVAQPSGRNGTVVVGWFARSSQPGTGTVTAHLTLLGPDGARLLRGKTIAVRLKDTGDDACAQLLDKAGEEIQTAWESCDRIYPVGSQQNAECRLAVAAGFYTPVGLACLALTPSYPAGDYIYFDGAGNVDYAVIQEHETDYNFYGSSYVRLAAGNLCANDLIAPRADGTCFTYVADTNDAFATANVSWTVSAMWPDGVIDHYTYTSTDKYGGGVDHGRYRFNIPISWGDYPMIMRLDQIAVCPTSQGILNMCRTIPDAGKATEQYVYTS